MPLVAAKCTDCGGAVKVDSEKKAAVCQYCGNAFVVEDAINNFNIHYFNTTNISNSIVHIHEDKNRDFVIEGGVLKKYTGAAVDVVIPDTVIKIGSRAFEGSMIKSVVIPDSVIDAEGFAFVNCSQLKNVTMSQHLYNNLTSSNSKIETVFYNTPYYKTTSYYQWKAKGLCAHCGGKLRLSGKCKSCGQL